MENILVGVDGSSTSQLALRWASDCVRRHGGSVTALLAWDWLNQTHLSDEVRFDPQYSEANAQKALETIVERALGPDHGVTCWVELDHAGPALARASGSVSLLVVGARGLGGFRGLLLGSVSRHVLHHATCPVVVIRDDVDHAAGPIVVGVDGSEASIRALEWAVAYGAADRSRVVVVHAWQYPITAAVGPLLLVEHRRQLEFAAGQVLDSVMERAASGEGSGIDDRVERRVVEGPPAAELLAAVDRLRASLLVVGARGERGVAGLLGSVSDQVVRHASCPVVVVP